MVLMATMFGLFPFLLKLYADIGYQGPKFQIGLRRVCRTVNVEIVKRPIPASSSSYPGDGSSSALAPG